MGEESRFDQIAGLSGDNNDDNDDNADADADGRVTEWEIGLPADSDLPPLSQSLVPPPLASAFRINPEPSRSFLDVDRASHHTISTLRRLAPSAAALAALRSFRPFSSPAADDYDAYNTTFIEDVAPAGGGGGDGCNSSSKAFAVNAAEEAESSAFPMDNSNDENSARTLKRPRLVWTPQLHKRFVDVVGHIGIKNAVPKTIMQLMNVEGLTRENVASHLQKYRLYVKRMQGHSSEGPSSSTDHLFASTPLPQSLREPQAPVQAVAMPYGVPAMIQMPVYGVQQPYGHGVQMGMVNNHQVPGVYHGFGGHHPYGEVPKDWSGGN